MKQNGMRLEYKTPREITNMDHKMSSKDCSEVKQVAVSTLQEKQYLAKQQSFVNNDLIIIIIIIIRIIYSLILRIFHDKMIKCALQ